jgi:sec-independent protein translocase protein TatA
MTSTMALAGFNFANIGMPEMVILLAIVLIIFGPKKLPSLGRAIGKSIREFKGGMKDLGSVLDEEEETNGKPVQTADLDPKPVNSGDHAVTSSSDGEPAKTN